MKRFLALLAALALVLLAVLARGLIDSSASDGGDGAGRNGDPDEGLSLICGPELLAVCNALADEVDGVAVIEQAEAQTADELAGGELELGDNTVWLAAGDWPAIADEGSGEMPELASSEVLARSPAVIVGPSERLAAVGSECDDIDWSCIGDSAGEAWTSLGGEAAWGRVEVGLPSVDAGSGMVAVNQAVASRVGTSDFATNDLTEPTVASWFEGLAQEAGADTSALEPVAELVRVQGSLSMAGALESDAIRELDGAARASSFRVLAPKPVATADVRLWAPTSEAVTRAMDTLGTERLSAALNDTGWRIPDGSGNAPPPPGAASIEADMASFDTVLPDTGPPDSSGLPSPGTVFTVNTRWRDSQ